MIASQRRTQKTKAISKRKKSKNEQRTELRKRDKLSRESSHSTAQRYIYIYIFRCCDLSPSLSHILPSSFFFFLPFNCCYWLFTWKRTAPHLCLFVFSPTCIPTSFSFLLPLYSGCALTVALVYTEFHSFCPLVFLFFPFFCPLPLSSFVLSLSLSHFVTSSLQFTSIHFNSGVAFAYLSLGASLSFPFFPSLFLGCRNVRRFTSYHLL